jgi:hypothetical protein
MQYHRYTVLTYQILSLCDSSASERHRSYKLTSVFKLVLKCVKTFFKLIVFPIDDNNKLKPKTTNLNAFQFLLIYCTMTFKLVFLFYCLEISYSARIIYTSSFKMHCITN